MQAVMGIDVSKEKLDVVLVTEEGQWSQTFSNQGGGFKKLVEWMKGHGATEAHVCLEATGRYGEGVAEYLLEEGYRVSVVNPARIAAYGKSQLSRTKTDRTDAALIADFCRTQQPEAWTPPSPALKELRSLVRRLEALQEMRQQELNRLKALPSSDTVAQSLHDHLAFLDQQIKALMQGVQGHIDRNPDLKRNHELLTSIPGIGDLTAFKLQAELPPVHTFTDVRQWVAFAGLSPRQYRSGSSVRGRTRLAKTGSARLRSTLFFPAIVAKTHNPIVRAFCARLLDRGLAPLAVIGAAMRKLMHLIYGILKSGKPFDPSFASLPA